MPIIYGGKGKLIGSGAPAIPWYLAGGLINAAAAILAYDADAVDYATSKINQVTPGTYNLVDTAHVPDWDGIGWTFAVSKYFDTGYIPAAGEYTIFLQYITFPANSFFGCSADATFGSLTLRNVGVTSLSRRSKALGNDIYWDPLANPSGKVAVSRTRCYCNGVALTNLYGGNNTDMDALGISLYFGASNLSTGIAYGAGKFSRCALYSGNLTTTQMAAITSNP
jgi:hypothetical protein